MSYTTEQIQLLEQTLKSLKSLKLYAQDILAMETVLNYKERIDQSDGDELKWERGLLADAVINGETEMMGDGPQDFVDGFMGLDNAVRDLANHYYPATDWKQWITDEDVEE